MLVMEYRRLRMIAAETDRGWQIEIVTQNGGQNRDTLTYPQISDAIDEAKQIIDDSLSGK